MPPESVTKVGDDITIISKTFKPPTDAWKFKEFGGTPTTHVDVFHAPGSLDPVKDPGADDEIKVAVEEVPLDTAEDFPVRCEGNLVPPPGGEGEPPYWRAKIAMLDLDADIDRDGTVEDNSEDENPEESVGTIVIADKEEVYSDPDEPAQRREIVLRRHDQRADKIRLKRSSSRLRVYDAQTGGTEQFGEEDEVALSAGTYWLQGGEEPSQGIRQDFLKIRDDKDAADYVDQINVTVLWVNIVGRNVDWFKPDPVYDGEPNIRTVNGHTKLGARRSTKGSQHGDWCVTGNFEADGWILPFDLDWRNAFDQPITSGFSRTEDEENPVAKADFGFTFRRILTSGKIYTDGLDLRKTHTNKKDDSERAFQDVDPDREEDVMVGDGDGPVVAVHIPLLWIPEFGHIRYNFLEHVVFYFHKGEPERCSEKLKWAVSQDAGHDAAGAAVFVRGKPNDGDEVNEVIVGKHLESLELNLVQPHLADAAPKQLKRDTESKIVITCITGTNLIGSFFLYKGEDRIPARTVNLIETDPDNEYSDCTFAVVLFDTTGRPAGAGWELVLVNSSGSSNVLTGFELVDEE